MHACRATHARHALLLLAVALIATSCTELPTSARHVAPPAWSQHTMSGTALYGIRYDGPSDTWQLLLFDGSGGERVVFAGRRAIESAAVAATGDVLLAMAATGQANSVNAVYHFRIDGDGGGTWPTPRRQTPAAENATSVSITADGATWVWEATNAAGRRAVFVRRGDTQTMLEHDGDQIQPSISGDGLSIALVRPAAGSTGSNGVFVLRSTNGSYIEIARSTQLVSQPSVSNEDKFGKVKVAFHWDVDQEQRVQIHDLADGSVLTAVALRNVTLARPHLSPDGGRLVYTTHRNGTSAVWSRVLANNEVIRVWNAAGQSRFVSGGHVIAAVMR